MKETFDSNLAPALAANVDEKTVRNILAGMNVSLASLEKIFIALRPSKGMRIIGTPKSFT